VSNYKVRGLLGLTLVALVIAGCGSSKKSSSTSSTAAKTPAATTVGKGQIAVLLPDTQSSVRWEQFDRKYLNAAFTKAGISHTIVNAQGDPTTQRTQAEQAITNGAKVILLVDLDPGSGAAIISLAHQHGVKVIDYDRLTLGGGADYYVSFDNTRVGLGQLHQATGAQQAGCGGAQRLAIRQQRDPVRQRLQLGPDAAVQVGHALEGPQSVGADVG
jgi:D-xylose transport system substrate-binding protein